MVMFIGVTEDRMFMILQQQVSGSVFLILGLLFSEHLSWNRRGSRDTRMMRTRPHNLFDHRSGGGYRGLGHSHWSLCGLGNNGHGLRRGQSRHKGTGAGQIRQGDLYHPNGSKFLGVLL
jgi:hypothetical protein